MPATTASSRPSFATRRLVKSARLSTLTAGASIVGAATYSSRQFGRRRGISAGEQRREDENHRALRRKRLLDRLVDDEGHAGFIGERVMGDRDGIERRAHGAG